MKAAFALILLAAASLAVFPPPHYLLWKLSIAVKEGGHWLAPPCLFLSLWSLVRPGWSAKAAGGMFLVAAFLLASPLARAYLASSRLQQAFVQAFPGAAKDHASLRPAPLSVRDLLLGLPVTRGEPRTLVYARRGGSDLRLDFLPASGAAGPAPCLLVVHGGGWDGGDRRQLDELNHHLARRGYAVASLDYRLAPAHRYPAPVEDVGAALAYLRSHAAGLRIDSSRLVLLGRSAGGQIALQAAYAGREAGLRGVIAFYAPADMVFGYSLPVNPRILDSRKLMENYLGGTYGAVPDAYRASSPVEAVASGSPPTLLLHGHPDVLVAYEHTRRLRARLASLGVRHFVVDLPWAAHGYDYMFSGPGSQLSLYFLERFLLEVTG